MSIDTQQRCACGYYVDANGNGDTGSCKTVCPECGQEWLVEWRVYWERGAKPEEEGGETDGSEE
jgi:hypothetical protein